LSRLLAKPSRLTGMTSATGTVQAIAAAKRFDLVRFTLRRAMPECVR
jgi:hypothetical protein